MNKKRLGLITGAVGISILLGLSNFAAYAKPSKDAIKPGDDLPEITLNLKEQKKAKKYFGQQKIKPFSISEIPAKLILLDILSST
jgi:hypothetical protein